MVKKEVNQKVYQFVVSPLDEIGKMPISILTVSAFTAEDAIAVVKPTLGEKTAQLIGHQDLDEFLAGLKVEIADDETRFDAKIEHLIQYLKDKGYKVTKPYGKKAHNKRTAS